MLINNYQSILTESTSLQKQLAPLNYSETISHQIIKSAAQKQEWQLLTFDLVKSGAHIYNIVHFIAKVWRGANDINAHWLAKRFASIIFE